MVFIKRYLAEYSIAMGHSKPRKGEITGDISSLAEATSPRPLLPHSDYF